MVRTACLVANDSSLGGRCKNIGRQSGDIYSPGPPALSARLPSLCPLLEIVFLEVDFFAN